MKLPASLVLVSTLAPLGIGLFQHRQLAAMQQTLSSMRAARQGSHSLSSDSGDPVANPREPQRQKGTPDLSLMLHLLKDQTSGNRTDDDLDPETREAGLERLSQLFMKTDAATAARLFQALAGNPASLKLATQLFSGMNPQQSLLFHLAREEDRTRPDVLATDLGNWAYTAPSEALSWYRDALAKNDPALSAPPIKAAILPPESLVDPKLAVADAVQLMQEDPSFLRNVSFIDILQGNDERRAFLNALADAAQDPGKAQIAGSIRESFVSSLDMLLRQEPIPESTEVLDEAYTAEERKQFCRSLDGGPQSDEWVPWLVKQSLPANDTHPIVLMAMRAAIKNREPGWLSQLPEGQLRDHTLVRFLDSLSDISLASKWVPELPPGGVRDAMEKDLRDGWKNHGVRKLEAN